MARGDVLDRGSVVAALAGAQGAYLLLPTDMRADDLLARNRTIAVNLASALGEAPVPHAVFLSSVGAQHAAGTGPIVTTHVAECLLGTTRTTFTFLRAAYFMENLLANVPALKGDEVLPVFGGGESFRFPMVATPDIGEAAAAALLAPPSASERVAVVGPEDYGMADAARLAGEVRGRPVNPLVLPIDAMVPTLTSFGVSANMASLYREMTEGLGKGLVAYEGTERVVRGKVGLRDVLVAALS